MGAHDSGYKKLFSFPTMVEDLLRGFVQEPWVAKLDFTTLERTNGSYVSDDLREREDDIIWRAKWMGEESWLYVYFLLEFQSKHDFHMGIRVWNYISLLYQDLINTGNIDSGERLPPVLPMVVYRGEQKWTAPLDIKDLIQQPPPGLARYLPSLRYLLLEEVRMNEAELERMRNLVAEIFRIEKSATLDAAIPPFVSFLKWTTKAGAQQDSLKRAFKAWFTRAQKPAKIIGEDDAIDEMSPEEMEPMLSERIEKWSNELMNKGRAEGETEGEARGRAEGEARGMAVGQARLFMVLFEKRFGPMSDDLKARVAASDADAILRFSERLLSAKTKAEVFAAD